MTDALLSHLFDILATLVMGGITLVGGYIAWVLRKADAKLHDFALLPKMMGDANQSLAKVTKRQDELATAMIDLKAEFVARGDLSFDEAHMSFDKDGLMVHAGRTLCRWLGVGEADLNRWGWTNYILAEDREKFRAEFDACLRDHRECAMQVHLMPINGVPLCVKLIIVPIPDAPPARAWIGSMRRCKAKHEQAAAA